MQQFGCNNLATILKETRWKGLLKTVKKKNNGDLASAGLMAIWGDYVAFMCDKCYILLKSGLHNKYYLNTCAPSCGESQLKGNAIGYRWLSEVELYCDRQNYRLEQGKRRNQ